MSYYCYIFEGTYEIDELDQAWLQLVNEKRKYKSKTCTCNILQPLLSLSVSLCLPLLLSPLSPSPPVLAGSNGISERILKLSIMTLEKKVSTHTHTPLVTSATLD